MQKAAEEAADWSSANNMQLNTDKIKEIIVYYGRKELCLPHIKINGHEIERVDELCSTNNSHGMTT